MQKKDAAERWVNAVNNDGTYGTWFYKLITKSAEVNTAINECYSK